MGIQSGNSSGKSKTDATTSGTSTTTPNAPSFLTTPWQNYAAQVGQLPESNPANSGPSSLQQQAFSGAAGLTNNLLSNIDISKYMNPYTQNVIDTGVNDLNRARQMAIVGNSAASANAGGNAWMGDRAGVADSETNRGFLDQVASLTANLRNTGYNNAQSAAQFDIGARRDNLNQQASLGEQQRAITMASDPYAMALQRMYDQAGLLGAIPANLFTGSTTTENGVQKGVTKGNTTNTGFSWSPSPGQG